MTLEDFGRPQSIVEEQGRARKYVKESLMIYSDNWEY